jgi:hypothetical protein
LGDGGRFIVVYSIFKNLMMFNYPQNRTRVRSFICFLFPTVLVFSSFQVSYSQTDEPSPKVNSINKKNTATISGFVKDKNSGEMLGGVNVAVLPNGVITATNKYGFYSITIPRNTTNIYKSVVANYPTFQMDSFSWSGQIDSFVNFVENKSSHSIIDCFSIILGLQVFIKKDKSFFESAHKQNRRHHLGFSTVILSSSLNLNRKDEKFILHIR